MSAASPRTGFSLPVLIALLIGAAIMLTPMIWTLLLSFKSNAALMADSGAAFSAPTRSRTTARSSRLAHYALAAQQPDRVAVDHRRRARACVRWRLRLRPA
jgi:ABC-type glycerol-3-phosphate transport system permease component